MITARDDALLKNAVFLKHRVDHRRSAQPVQALVVGVGDHSEKLSVVIKRLIRVNLLGIVLLSNGSFRFFKLFLQMSLAVADLVGLSDQ